MSDSVKAATRGGWQHRAEYLLFRLLVCVVDSLSPRATAWSARMLARIMHALPRKWTRYHIARENLQRAFGPTLSEVAIDRTIYQMWVHLFRLVAEIIQAPRKLNLHSYRDIIQFADFTRTNEAVCSGRRVLLVGGHFGNWEAGMALFALWGFPMGIVAREMDNPYLDGWFRQYREQTGHRLLAKKGNFDEMLELLRKGGNIGLLGDQDAGPRGMYVDFFGTPASTHKSIALLSMQYDAPIVVGYSLRLPDDFATSPWFRFEVGCEAMIDPRLTTTDDPVREITQAYTSALERCIRRAPEQYFWVHRRWKSVPRTVSRQREPRAA